MNRLNRTRRLAARAFGVCEIGYSILPPYQRQGFASEAAQALIALLRSGQRIGSVIAHTSPHLTGSLRIYPGEGTLRAALKRKRGRARNGAVPAAPARLIDGPPVP